MAIDFPARPLNSLLCAVALACLGSACETAVAPQADASLDELPQDAAVQLDTVAADSGIEQEVVESQPDTASEDTGGSEDASLADGDESPDSVAVDMGGPPDIAPPKEDVMEEDLSEVDITWTKDIEYISQSKCDNCHGVAGGSGLKLYSRQQWIDYFPMIVPSLETGKMPKSGSLAPGQLETIKLWGKVGYPE
jgi:hypothetical protein